MSFQETLQTMYIPDSELAKTPDLRSEYAKSMTEAPFNNKDRAKQIINKSLEEPIFEPHEWHPEDLPVRIDFLQASMDAAMDIMTVDYNIIAAENKYVNLISDTISRMNLVKERINRDKQRLEDINFITSAYSGLSNVIPITKDNISGSYTFNNNVYTAAATAQTDIPINILSVTGNGYTGNSYVLDPTDTFIEETDDRGKYSNLSDNTPLTVFEYSRLCSKDKSVYHNIDTGSNKENSIVNDDDKDVTCTIEFAPQSDDKQINLIKLDSPESGIKIQDVLISDNGKNYKSALGKSIDLTTDAYHAIDYTAGAAVVSFPTCSYVKLVLSSNHIDTSEQLGYKSIIIKDGKPETCIVKLDNAVRKIIRLGGINAYYNSYTKSSLLTDNLGPSENESYKTIALFANEYIPDAYSDELTPIVYTATVNGQEYNIVPVNSQADGTKMISCAEDHYDNAEVRFIDDEIKTVQVRVTLTPDSNGCTPFVGNLKLCIK